MRSDLPPGRNGMPQGQPARMPSDQELGADYTADLRRMWHAVLERGWIVIVAFVICVCLGAAYLNRAPVLYSSTTTIQVQQDQAPVFNIDNVRYENVQALDFLQTVAQSLKTRPLLERVAESEKLETNPNFISTTNGPPTRDDTLNALDRMVAVKLRRGTRLIDVSVTHGIPKLTSKVANALVAEYISDNAREHVSNTEVANGALVKEADRLKKKLQESENALQAYKEKSNASSLDDRQNTVVAELKEMSTKATEAKSLRIRLESDYNQVTQLGTNIDGLMTLPNVANNPAVVAARLALARAENDFSVLRQRYKEKHPKYIQAKTQIEGLQSELNESVEKAAQVIKASLEGARASEEALVKALRAQEASALELNKLSIQYGVLSREVESDRALYESVLKALKETSVSKEIKPMKIRVVQPAYTPEKPFSPRRAMIMAMSAMAGVFVGIALVLCLTFIDSSIKTVDEAETLLGLPVMTTVSNMKEVKKHKAPLVVVDEAKSSGAEAFRTLRTGLSMLGRVEDRRVFLFTSALPQEGKTFCSLNYAASLSQLGLKTLVIDGDLRRPTVELTLLGEEKDSFGVTDYLTGTKSLDEVAQPTRVKNLFYISGGTTAPNPAELLASDGLSGLIEDALQKFDRVIIDSAPIHAVSDTLLMLKNVQTVCLVVRAARTSGRSVLRCIHLLRGAEAPLSGVILNRMPVRRGLRYGHYNGGYYDYRYNGKYSKKGVYGEGESRSKRSRSVTPEPKSDDTVLRS